MNMVKILRIRLSAGIPLTVNSKTVTLSHSVKRLERVLPSHPSLAARRSLPQHQPTYTVPFDKDNFIRETKTPSRNTGHKFSDFLS